MHIYTLIHREVTVSKIEKIANNYLHMLKKAQMSVDPMEGGMSYQNWVERLPEDQDSTPDNWVERPPETSKPKSPTYEYNPKVEKTQEKLKEFSNKVRSGHELASGVANYFDPGKIDGKLGPMTRSAIGYYKRLKELNITKFLDSVKMGQDDIPKVYEYVYSALNGALGRGMPTVDIKPGEPGVRWKRNHEGEGFQFGTPRKASKSNKIEKLAKRFTYVLYKNK